MPVTHGRNWRKIYGVLAHLDGAHWSCLDGDRCCYSPALAGKCLVLR